MADLTKKARVACGSIRLILAKVRATNSEFVEISMEHTHQLPVRRHFSELALEAVWIVDEPTGNDAKHAQALSRAGFGFSGGRFLVQAH
jgi:hypothetical protein